MYYYFEPTSSLMSEGLVKTRIGEIVLSYSSTRQRDMGLFRAAFDESIQYNMYTHAPDGFSWVKFENSEDLETQFPELHDRNMTSGQIVDFQSPFYVQMWNIVPLSGQNETAAIEEAKLKIGTEVARLLSSLSGYATQNGCPDSVTNYISEILALSTQPGYPAEYAYSAHTGTYEGWPIYPDLSTVLESIAATPVATTSADIAFTRIINSYSVPGSYPNKVTAIQNAVAIYGVNGSVTDIYDHAVAALSV